MRPLEPSRATVAGGCGFLGGAEICRQLVARGTETHSLNRRPSREPAAPGVPQHRADLRDPVPLTHVPDGCDAVTHNAITDGTDEHYGRKAPPAPRG